MTTGHAGAARPVGVFDSGVGGLSILRSLRAQLPAESFVYLADAGFAPYGERGDAFVIERTRAVVRQLRDVHIRTIEPPKAPAAEQTRIETAGE